VSALDSGLAPIDVTGCNRVDEDRGVRMVFAAGAFKQIIPVWISPTVNFVSSAACPGRGNCCIPGVSRTAFAPWGKSVSRDNL